MALFSTLVDNFPGASLDALWVAGTGTVSVASNVCTLACGSTYSQIGSASTYSLTGSSIYAEMGVPTYGNGSKQLGLGLNVSQAGGSVNSIQFTVGGSAINAILWQAGVQTTVAYTTYSATTMAYWRIREASGTIYWDYGPDGVNWTNFTSSTYTLSITSLYAEAYCGYYGTESASNGTIANVNYSIGGGGGGVIAVVQQGDTGGLVNSGSAGTVLSTNPTIGHTIALGVVSASTNADDLNTPVGICSSWTRVNDNAYMGTGDIGWWTGTVTSASTSVTITSASANQWGAQATEISGTVGTIASGGTLNGTGVTTALTMSGLSSGYLIFALANSNYNFDTSNPTSPWVDYNTGLFVITNGLDTAYQLTTSSTSQTATWVGGSTAYWQIAGLIIEPSIGTTVHPLAAPGSGMGFGPHFGNIRPLAAVGHGVGVLGDPVLANTGLSFKQWGDSGALINSGTGAAVLPTNATIGNTIALAAVSLSGTANDINTPVGICAVWTRVNDLGIDPIWGDNEWWVGTVTSAAETITITTNSGDQWLAQATEVTGTVASALTGGEAYNDSTGGTSYALTVSGLVSGDLVFVFANAAANFDTSEPASPWTDYNAGFWTANNGLGTAYQIVSTTSVTATWTGPGVGLWGAIGLILTPSTALTSVLPSAAAGVGIGVAVNQARVFPLAAPGVGVGHGIMEARGFPLAAAGVGIGLTPTVVVPAILGTLLHPTGFPLLALSDTYNTPAPSSYTMPHTYGTIGDIAILGVIGESVTSVVSIVTGVCTGAWVLGPRLTDHTDAWTLDIWTAPVISVASKDALTIAWSGPVTTVYADLWGDSLTAGYGVYTVWTIVASGNQANAVSATVPYPNLASGPTTTPKAYWGIGDAGAILQGGSTGGFTYIDSISGSSNEQIFSLTLDSNTSYAPTSTQTSSADSATVAIILSASQGGPEILPHPVMSLQAVPRHSFR
jgi:hypothetical protein